MPYYQLSIFRKDTYMEKRMMGATGMEVSVLGYGAAEIGFTSADEDTVARILNTALDSGLNVIDTAECYGSESVLGKTIAHRRDDYYLFTKCGHSSGFDLPDWNVQMLEQTIDRSLRLLRTDCVDLINLHSCSEDELRKGDVISVLQRARDAGKTRFIGYSGDSMAARYAIECGAFDVLETSVSIADQESLTLTLPLAEKKGMGVIAKRPIANTAWIKGEPEDHYGHTYWQRLKKLDYPFLHESIGSAVETALRFTLGAPGVHTAIVGSTNPERWKENAGYAEKGRLSPEEYQAIRDRWQSIAGNDWVGQI
jgi:aryl-alcohol dehydrogenase-like predicted oxidoreductase